MDRKENRERSHPRKAKPEKGVAGLPRGCSGKEATCRRRGTQVPSLGWEDERWKWQPTPVVLSGNPGKAEEPGRLQCVGSQKSQHVLAAKRQPQRAGGGDWVVPLGEEPRRMLGELDYLRRRGRKVHDAPRDRGCGFEGSQHWMVFDELEQR